MNVRRSQIVWLIVLALCMCACAVLRILIDRPIDGPVGLAWPSADLARFRYSALAVGAIAGCALAVSGVLLQSMLRNPLASPFVLGISAGAALGVIVGMYIRHRFGLAFSEHRADVLPALGGAGAAMLIVYSLSQRRGWIDPVSLILLGVIVSTMCGALIMFFHYLVPDGLVIELTRWMMGRIREDAAPGTLILLGACTAIGLLLSGGMSRAMDAATLGDDEARSIGLSIGPLRIVMFVIASALTAISVALCGPIGFVGLVSPHIARLILGPRHAVLVFGSAMVGVCIIVGADVARQFFDLDKGRMPIGVFTAMIGGPVFIWLLRSGRGNL